MNPQQSKKQQVCVVGGGLAGPMIGIMLAKKGYLVKIMEGRSDMRLLQHQAGRSINLTLSVRGFRALESVGLKEQVTKMSVPLIGRMIHDLDGQSHSARYGTLDSDAIYSVSRKELNCELLRLAEETKGIELVFDTKCLNYDLKSNILHFKNRNDEEAYQVKDHLVIAADGFNSIIRQALMKDTRLDFSMAYETHGYKELILPAGINGEWQLEKTALHIWPRGGFMITGIPNKDGGYTCTLFLSYKDGTENFENLKTDEQIETFFQTYFPDVLGFIPNIAEQFQKNPIGDLCTLKTWPWNYEDKAILIGDAAHSLVPFYGQGMNCALEDCFVFSQLLDAYDGKDLSSAEWTTLLDEFAKSRKPNADAIQDMALENFIELRDSVSDRFFKLKKECELIVSTKYPDFKTKYFLVAFSQVPYSIAKKRGEVNNEILSELCSKCSDSSEFDEDLAYRMILRRYEQLNL